MNQSLAGEYDLAFDMNNIVSPERIKAAEAALGKVLSEEKFQIAYDRINKLFQSRNLVYAKEVEAIFNEAQDWPDTGWNLVSVQVNIDNELLPCVSLILMDPQGKKQEAHASDKTSVHAIFSAIVKIVGIHAFILDFSYSNIVPSLDSLCQAKIRLRHHDIEVKAKACSIDFIEAVTKAFLLAANKIKVSMDQRQS